jgi:hypothetical protein
VECGQYKLHVFLLAPLVINVHIYLGSCVVVHIHKIPSMQETEVGGSQSESDLGKSERPCRKNKRKQKGLMGGVGCVAHVVEYFQPQYCPNY